MGSERAKEHSILHKDFLWKMHREDLQKSILFCKSEILAMGLHLQVIFYAKKGRFHKPFSVSQNAQFWLSD